MSKRSKQKPDKPYREYPLFAHDSGRWAKKIRGKLEYFGYWARRVNGKLTPVDSPDLNAGDALELYKQQVDDLQAGRRPQPLGGVKVRDVVNAFLTSKLRKVESGELKASTFRWYSAGVDHMVKSVGPTRRVDDLRPDDFGRLRAKLAKQYAASELGKLIQLVRSVFKYGFDAALMDAPMRFGPEFSRPSAKAMRQARQAKGDLSFDAAMIRKLIESANVPMKAMILLGVNAGWGQTDIAELPLSALDLDAGVADFPRPKTAIDRRVTLWPETVKAIREAIDARPTPRSKADAELVFLTQQGRRWVRFKPGKSDGKGASIDSVSLQFNKLLKAHDAKRKGLGFYSLRRTFRTVADEIGDRPAIDLIMGHTESNYMGTRYVQRIADDRLRAVTGHVRDWLGLDTKPKKKTKATAPKRSKSKGKSKAKTGKPKLRLVG